MSAFGAAMTLAMGFSFIHVLVKKSNSAIFVQKHELTGKTYLTFSALCFPGVFRNGGGGSCQDGVAFQKRLFQNGGEGTEGGGVGIELGAQPLTRIGSNRAVGQGRRNWARRQSSGELT